ncbi:MAG: serine hydrolase domain-containing protein [Acidimicrobiia bacterium]
MRRRPLLLLLSVALSAGLALAGASAGAATAGGACPKGTQRADGLCVASTQTARDAAAVVQSTFTEQSLGAVVVGVWKNGKPLLVGALGESLTGVPATADMHHRAGNLTASMLTTVFLQLVDEGKLSLDDKLSKWYPDLPGADQVTLQMLARSTSGYEHYTILDSFAQAFYVNPFRAWTPDELIAYGVGSGPLFPPGTSWKFSDTNLILLQQVLAKTTGKSVTALVRERIWKPLGMKDTTGPENAALPEPVLHSYTDERTVWEEATFWNPTWTAWAGGAGTTQDDAHTWIEAVASGKLLSKAGHEAQLGPATAGLGSNTEARYYAMGIAVVNGWVFTNPALQGYRGAIGTLPDQKLTIVVYNTLSPKSDPEKRQATLLFQELSKAFAPDQPMDLGVR